MKSLLTWQKEERKYLNLELHRMFGNGKDGYVIDDSDMSFDCLYEHMKAHDTRLLTVLEKSVVPKKLNEDLLTPKGVRSAEADLNREWNRCRTQIVENFRLINEDKI